MAISDLSHQTLEVNSAWNLVGFRQSQKDNLQLQILLGHMSEGLYSNPTGQNYTAK